MKNVFTDFAMGLIVGFISAVIICSVIAGFVYSHNKNKELIEYVEKQMEIEELREDIVNRDPDEFLEIPGVRRAADGATAEFDRKRDEILERFRGGFTD